jgi:DNA polymerase-2
MDEGATITGGLVLDAVPGLHRNVCVFDFRSLYPSLVRTFNVDPCTWVPDADAGVSVIRTPSGACFRRDDEGILPALVGELWDERARCRAAGDAVGAQVTKILMNSLFGVLGSPASRLFAPPVANAITLAGQWVIRTTARAAEAHGARVVYGDTDSLFVVLDEADTARAAERGRRLRATLEAEVGAAVAREFATTSRLELAFAKVYAHLFMPELRGGGASKKRYAGLVDDALEIVGLEAVRRDWSLVARRFQRELLTRVLREEPVDGFVRDFVTALRAGACDAELVLRTAIRKPLASYVRTTPPHVQAARKAGLGDGGIVRWVMTTSGPEVVDGTTAPPDHAWYVTHQLQPIADAVLRFVPGATFADLAGLRRQLDLFR